jgi:hypothetical protein
MHNIYIDYRCSFGTSSFAFLSASFSSSCFLSEGVSRMVQSDFSTYSRAFSMSSHLPNATWLKQWNSNSSMEQSYNIIVAMSTGIASAILAHRRLQDFHPRSPSSCSIHLFRTQSLRILIIDSNPNILNYMQFWPGEKTLGLEQSTPCP